MIHFLCFIIDLYVNHELIADIILYVDILFIQSQNG